MGQFVAERGCGRSVNTSSGKGRFNYDNLFAGGADAINRGTPVSFYPDDKIDAVTKLNADYFLPRLPEKLALGLGFSYFFENYKSIKSGAYAFDNRNNRIDYPRNYEVITKIDPRGHFSFGFKPGYQIQKNLLIYSMLSYHHMRASLSSVSFFDKSNLPLGVVRAYDFSTRRSFNGLGLGGGVKYKFFKNWFVDLSAEWVNFSRKNIPGPILTSSFDEVTMTQDEKVHPKWVDISSSFGYQFG